MNAAETRSYTPLPEHRTSSTNGNQIPLEPAEAQLHPIQQSGFNEDNGIKYEAIYVDPLGIYLSEIDQFPLLKSEEEIELTQSIEKGKLAEVKLHAVGYLTMEDQVELRRDVTAGEEAHKKMSESNLRLVVSIAKKYVGKGLPLLDLIQEGNLGLDRAIDKFDYRRGFKFSTPATWWIRQAVTRAISDTARTVRLPVHIIEEFNRMIRAENRLTYELGREPTPEETGQELGITPQAVINLQRYAKQPISVDTPIYEDEYDSDTIKDTVEDKSSQGTENQGINTILEGEVEELMSSLTDREKIVIKLRFGLGNGRKRSLSEVGNEIGVTRERARQIERDTLNKLRANPNIGKFRSYLE